MGESSDTAEDTDGKPVGNKNGKKGEGLMGSSFFTWFMIITLLGVWTSVAVVWFDLVDYEDVLGKLGVYDADGDGDFDVEDAKVLLGLSKDGSNVNLDSFEEVLNILAEEGSDWFYGFLTFLYDVMTPFEILEDEESEAAEDVADDKLEGVAKRKVKMKDENLEGVAQKKVTTKAPSPPRNDFGKKFRDVLKEHLRLVKEKVEAKKKVKLNLAKIEIEKKAKAEKAEKKEAVKAEKSRKEAAVKKEKAKTKEKAGTEKANLKVKDKTREKDKIQEKKKEKEEKPSSKNSKDTNKFDKSSKDVNKKPNTNTKDASKKEKADKSSKDAKNKDDKKSAKNSHKLLEKVFPKENEKKGNKK